MIGWTAIPALIEKTKSVVWILVLALYLDLLYKAQDNCEVLDFLFFCFSE